MSAEIPTELSSNYPFPWVLVAHGGVMDGQRPRTKLGFITKAIVKDHRVVECKILIERAPGEFYKTPTPCPPARVLHEFRGPDRLARPNDRAIAEAKSQVPVWHSGAGVA